MWIGRLRKWVVCVWVCDEEEEAEEGEGGGWKKKEEEEVVVKEEKGIERQETLPSC